MTPQSDSFYANNVLVEQFDYTVVPNPQPIQRSPEQTRISSRLLRTVASVAAGGVLVFGPFGVSAPASHVGTHGAEVVVVHVRGPESGPAVQVPRVAVPDSHRRAADRFRKLFRAVPLNEVEKIPDPDFGL